VKPRKASRTAAALALAVPESPITQMRMGSGVPGSGEVTKLCASSPPANATLPVPIS
jgi:hypothetical protein